MQILTGEENPRSVLFLQQPLQTSAGKEDLHCLSSFRPQKKEAENL